MPKSGNIFTSTPTTPSRQLVLAKLAKSSRPAKLRKQAEFLRHRKVTVVQAVAEITDTAKTEVVPLQEGNWYAVVANADFMLHDVQNEAFAEQLRERKRLFREKKKPLDFWLVSEPSWLDEQFPKESKKVGRPCVALVSADQIWINFMKLRLDRVLRLDLGSKSLQEILRSNGPVPERAYKPLDREGKWTAPYPPYRPGWWEVFMQPTD